MEGDYQMITAHEAFIILSPFLAIFLPLLIGCIIVHVTEAHKPYPGNVDFDQHRKPKQ
jgi:hypothetical protein